MLEEEASPFVSHLIFSFTTSLVLSSGYVTNAQHSAQHRPLWQLNQCIFPSGWLAIENYVLSMRLVMFSPL